MIIDSLPFFSNGRRPLPLLVKRGAMSDVFSRLKERQQARLTAIEQRKQEGQEDKRVEETSHYFTQQFDQRKSGKYY